MLVRLAIACLPACLPAMPLPLKAVLPPLSPSTCCYALLCCAALGHAVPCYAMLCVLSAGDIHAYSPVEAGFVIAVVFFNVFYFACEY